MIGLIGNQGTVVVLDSNRCLQSHTNSWTLGLRWDSITSRSFFLGKVTRAISCILATWAWASHPPTLSIRQCKRGLEAIRPTLTTGVSRVGEITRGQIAPLKGVPQPKKPQFLSFGSQLTNDMCGAMTSQNTEVVVDGKSASPCDQHSCSRLSPSHRRCHTICQGFPPQKHVCPAIGNKGRIPRFRPHSVLHHDENFWCRRERKLLARRQTK